ncbi:hypothetical protein [Zunongwangia endophytica]|uniref:Uncharacterized protein n=1 Tax=Zunongwangia endophytica TaxID=1808945 RepID=A0ABV8HC43_9FLAO|nr:hypothetical protein [Zunongwangia endophytica]MDN3593502.1 hypothetical protein [Zunongwangia endophytica]
MKNEPVLNDENNVATMEKYANDWLKSLQIIDFELVFYKSYLEDHHAGKTETKKSSINLLLTYISEQMGQNKFHLRTCLFYKNRVSKIKECDDVACEQIYLDAHSLFRNRLQDHFKKINLLKHQIIYKTKKYSALKIE